MDVTITLGKRALEYVTGIPEEELSEILSDVLERSLEQQVVSIHTKEEKSDDVLLSKMLEMIQSQLASGVVTPSTLSIQPEPAVKEPKISVVEDDKPIDLGPDLGMFDFLK